MCRGAKVWDDHILQMDQYTSSSADGIPKGDLVLRQGLAQGAILLQAELSNRSVTGIEDNGDRGCDTFLSVSPAMCREDKDGVAKCKNYYLFAGPG
jgi:hypothetical protein